jgi:hypothetical protein
MSLEGDADANELAFSIGAHPNLHRPVTPARLTAIGSTIAQHLQCLSSARQAGRAALAGVAGSG